MAIRNLVPKNENEIGDLIRDTTDEFLSRRIRAEADLLTRVAIGMEPGHLHAHVRTEYFINVQGMNERDRRGYFTEMYNRLADQATVNFIGQMARTVKQIKSRPDYKGE